MPNDAWAEYRERSDDELLHLASERTSLTAPAAAALDAELSRRHLTESDLAKHQQSVKRTERKEARRRRRKAFGIPTDPGDWLEVAWAAGVISVISIMYLALPSRFHMRSDWQEAAFLMIFVSAFVGVAARTWWREVAFWISLAVSSAIHLVVVHAWILRVTILSRNEGKLAVLSGFGLFFAVYGFSCLLRRNFYGEETRGN
jgi:hypothetical protein